MDIEVYLPFGHAVFRVNSVFAFLISPTELTVDYFYNMENQMNFLFGARLLLERFLLAASRMEMER
jgi:hypothetical protein